VQAEHRVDLIALAIGGVPDDFAFVAQDVGVAAPRAERQADDATGCPSQLATGEPRESSLRKARLDSRTRYPASYERPACMAGAAIADCPCS
jgi:hypothetical protein